LRKAKSS